MEKKFGPLTKFEMVGLAKIAAQNYMYTLKTDMSPHVAGEYLENFNPEACLSNIYVAAQEWEDQIDDDDDRPAAVRESEPRILRAHRHLAITLEFDIRTYPLYFPDSIFGEYALRAVPSELCLHNGIILKLDEDYPQIDFRIRYADRDNQVKIAEYNIEVKWLWEEHFPIIPEQAPVTLPEGRRVINIVHHHPTEHSTSQLLSKSEINGLLGISELTNLEGD